MQYGVLEDVELSEAWHTVTFPKEFPHAALSINISLSPYRGGQMQKYASAHGFVYGNTTPILKAGSLTTKGAIIGADFMTLTSAPNYVCNGRGCIYGNLYWTAFGY